MKWFASFLDALYPENVRCAVCGEEIAGTEPFCVCEHCAPKLARLPKEICPKCSSAYVDGVCPDCGGKGFLFRSLTAAYQYDTEIKSMILSYKENGERWRRTFFAQTLLGLLSEKEEKYDGIVYPPSGRNAKRRRGFDHMKAVAEALSAFSEIPVVRSIVKTEEATEKHAKLNREQRLRLSHQYALTEAPVGKTFLLIDDVATTCATLNEVTAAIKRQIPDAAVDAYVVARTILK